MYHCLCPLSGSCSESLTSLMSLRLPTEIAGGVRRLTYCQLCQLTVNTQNHPKSTQKATTTPKKKPNHPLSAPLFCAVCLLLHFACCTSICIILIFCTRQGFSDATCHTMPCPTERDGASIAEQSRTKGSGSQGIIWLSSLNIDRVLTMLVTLLTPCSRSLLTLSFSSCNCNWNCLLSKTCKERIVFLKGSRSQVPILVCNWLKYYRVVRYKPYLIASNIIKFLLKIVSLKIQKYYAQLGVETLYVFPFQKALEPFGLCYLLLMSSCWP